MPQLETILFRSTPTNSGMTGVVDHQSATLHGVALIQAELEAEGHSLWVDHALLHQLSELGRQNGQVQCNIDHGSGSSDTIGFIDGFRIDGNVLRGDLHLLKSHAQTVTLMEKAERMPKCVGLSAAFKGDPKGVTVGGKQCARAEKLLSFDLVTRPAAAPNGLFSAKDAPTSADLKRQIIALASTSAVDIVKLNVRTKPLNFMADPNQQSAEPTMADILAAVQQMSGRLEAAEQMNQQIVEHLQSQGQEQPGDNELFDQLSQLNGMTDEQLAAQGITRTEVDAAVSEYNNNLGTQQQEQEAPQYQVAGQEGEGDLAAVAAGEGGATTAAFSAMAKKVIALEAHIISLQAKEQDDLDAALSTNIESKMIALAEQNTKLREFAATKAAEVDALRLAGSSGTRPVKAGIAFSEVSKGGDVLDFNVVVQHKFAELMKKPGMTELKAKSQAIDFGVKKHSDAYKLHRKAGSPEITFSVQ